MIRIPVFLLLGVLALFSSVAAARSIEDIKQSGELKVAIRDNLPPMEFMDHGKLVGIDPELAEMLAQSLGVKPTWVFFKETKEREALLSEQKVDVVVSAYSVTEERMELVNFSESYFDSGSVILLRRSDRDNIRGHKHLDGKLVATLKGSVSAKTLDIAVPSAVSVLLPDGIGKGYELLKAEKVDAVLYDKPMLDFVAANNKNLYVVDEFPIDPNQYAIGLNLQDGELLGHVDHFLQEIKSNGKLKELLKKYSTESIDPALVDQNVKIKTYTVKDGDTLNRIALSEYGDPSRWREIYAYNRDTVTYANVIKRGQTLKLPDLPMKEKKPEKTQPFSSDTVSPQSWDATGNTCADQLKALKKLQDKLTKETYRDEEKRILAECKK